MAFDANLRHLNAGTKFKAELIVCNEDSPFYKLGVRVGEMVEGEMLDHCTDNPRVLFKVNKELLVLKESWKGNSHWVVFDSVIN